MLQICSEIISICVIGAQKAKLYLHMVGIFAKILFLCCIVVFSMGLKFILSAFWRKPVLFSARQRGARRRSTGCIPRLIPSRTLSAHPPVSHARGKVRRPHVFSGVVVGTKFVLAFPIELFTQCDWRHRAQKVKRRAAIQQLLGRHTLERSGAPSTREDLTFSVPAGRQDIYLPLCLCAANSDRFGSDACCVIYWWARRQLRSSAVYMINFELARWIFVG